VTKYQISAINSCWEKCDEKCAYMFNVYKNQLSRQTGSRNLTGPKTLPTIWYTYMTLVIKYQISAINSYWEKCDEKYLGRTEGQTDRGKIVYPSPPSGSGGIITFLFIHIEHISTFFSATIYGRNLIFGHKLHIGTPYRGKRFWTHQIPTSYLPTLLIFIHIEHICSFFVTFFSATIDGRNLIFGYKLHIGKLVTKYQISAINSCWEKCDEKCTYMFNVYKNQLSRQTGSRNLMGPKTLPTIWGTYMKLVTKYQISAINSCWEKCDEKCNHPSMDFD
jgi:hypothetical protein